MPRRRFGARSSLRGHGGQPEGEIQSVKSLMRDSVEEIARRSEERRMRPVEGGALD
jgi:hypothetical protein